MRDDRYSLREETEAFVNLVLPMTMKPQDKAFEAWKREAPLVPASWEDHKTTFDAGFEAGLRYAFNSIGDSMLGRPAVGKSAVQK